MLFRAKDLEAIFAGRSTLACRRWKKPTVKAGGTIRTALGMIGIDSIEVIDPAALTEAEARDAGYADLAGLISMFESQQGVCYRIRLHPAGADPRLALQADAALGADERQKLAGKLTRLDQASATGPWTRATLELIRDRPGVVSPRWRPRQDLSGQPSSSMFESSRPWG